VESSKEKVAQSYENLKIWQKAIALAEQIYTVTKKFPKEEIFGITSQIRRAVVSVSSNIAEGSSRSSKKDYCCFVDISLGSLKEVENLTIISVRLGYIDVNFSDKLLVEATELGKSLGGFRKYLLK